MRSIAALCVAASFALVGAQINEDTTSSALVILSNKKTVPMAVCTSLNSCADLIKLYALERFDLSTYVPCGTVHVELDLAQPELAENPNPSPLPAEEITTIPTTNTTGNATQNATEIDLVAAMVAGDAPVPSPLPLLQTEPEPQPGAEPQTQPQPEQQPATPISRRAATTLTTEDRLAQVQVQVCASLMQRFFVFQPVTGRPGLKRLCPKCA